MSKKTIESFMAEYDATTKTRKRLTEYLAKMKREGELFAGELELARSSGINTVALAGLRNEYITHLAYIPGASGKKAKYVWFHTPKDVPEKFRCTKEQLNG